MADCNICEDWWSGSSGNTWPPSPEIIERWRRRFFQAKGIHGKPMEDKCPNCDYHWQKMRAYIPPHGPRQG